MQDDAEREAPFRPPRSSGSVATLAATRGFHLTGATVFAGAGYDADGAAGAAAVAIARFQGLPALVAGDLVFY
jgi:hypothetical protein